MLQSSRNARLALATIVALVPLGTNAQDNGFYIEGFGGLSQLLDTDVTGSASASTGFDAGVISGLALGYDHADSRFRAKLEFAYRSGDASGAGVEGDFASTTFALNGYYDLPSWGDPRLTPYVGAGIAYISEIDFDITGGAAAGEYSDRGIMGGQLMLGANYALTDNLYLSGELRGFSAGSQTLNSDGGGRITADYNSVDAILGLGMRF